MTMILLEFGIKSLVLIQLCIDPICSLFSIMFLALLKKLINQNLNVLDDEQQPANKLGFRVYLMWIVL